MLRAFLDPFSTPPIVQVFVAHNFDHSILEERRLWAGRAVTSAGAALLTDRKVEESTGPAAVVEILTLPNGWHLRAPIAIAEIEGDAKRRERQRQLLEWEIRR